MPRNENKKHPLRDSLQAAGRRVVPAAVRRAMWLAMGDPEDWRMRFELSRLRRKVWTQMPGSTVRCLNYSVRINDGPNFYILYKDIFVRRIYHFESQRPDPRILDCGSNIGLSILYFKHQYPKARIVGFEPDPDIFSYLEENVLANGMQDVRLIRAALSCGANASTFYSDGKYGGSLSESVLSDGAQTWKRYEVPCTRLWKYLDEPVDFLKMNIEGSEWEVLSDSESRLRQIKEMVVEYHHLPGLPRTLHEILTMLHRQGFEYLLNDLDYQTNGGVRPPFQLHEESRYFLLIYAKRLD